MAVLAPLGMAIRIKGTAITILDMGSPVKPRARIIRKESAGRTNSRMPEAQSSRQSENRLLKGHSARRMPMTNMERGVTISESRPTALWAGAGMIREADVRKIINPSTVAITPGFKRERKKLSPFLAYKRTPTGQLKRLNQRVTLAPSSTASSPCAP